MYKLSRTQTIFQKIEFLSKNLHVVLKTIVIQNGSNSI